MRRGTRGGRNRGMKTREEIAETKEKEMGRKRTGGGLRNSRTLAGVVDVICSL